MPSERARYIVEIDDTQARRQLRGLHGAATGSGGGGGPTGGGRVGTGGGGGTSGSAPAAAGAGGAPIVGIGGGLGGLAKMAAALAALAPLAETVADLAAVAKPVFDQVSRFISDSLGVKTYGDEARAEQAAMQKVIGALGPAAQGADADLIRQMYQAYLPLTRGSAHGATHVEDVLRREMTNRLAEDVAGAGSPVHMTARMLSGDLNATAHLNHDIAKAGNAVVQAGAAVYGWLEKNLLNR